jgi:hypothetical protein
VDHFVCAFVAGDDAPNSRQILWIVAMISLLRQRESAQRGKLDKIVQSRIEDQCLAKVYAIGDIQPQEYASSKQNEGYP